MQMLSFKDNHFSYQAAYDKCEFIAFAYYYIPRSTSNGNHSNLIKNLCNGNTFCNYCLNKLI